MSWDLSALDGPHSLYTIHKHDPTYSNTTFTLNFCRPLKKSPDTPKNEDCWNNARGKALSLNSALANTVYTAFGRSRRLAMQCTLTV